jgi:pimeloyl-ACP methyl ester carboxylesterase
MRRRSNTLRRLLGIPSPFVHTSTPEAPPPSGQPTRVGLTLESLALLQLVRLSRAAPWLARAPRGRGQVVIDVPGWKSPESAMAPLRSYLRALGYDSRGWGFGINRGNPERDVELLAGHIENTIRDDRPIALVGWSLGGVIAREVARIMPNRISTVVTYGTPIGGPRHTLGASAFGEDECRRIEALAARLDRDNPIQVPMTAIYTKRDTVVDWRACIDRNSQRVRHVEVRSTHLGLGIDPDVWWTVADALRHVESQRTPSGAFAR